MPCNAHASWQLCQCASRRHVLAVIMPAPVLTAAIPAPPLPQLHLQGHAAVPHGGALARRRLNPLLPPHQQVGVQVRPASTGSAVLSKAVVCRCLAAHQQVGVQVWMAAALLASPACLSCLLVSRAGLALLVSAVGLYHKPLHRMMLARPQRPVRAGLLTLRCCTVAAAAGWAPRRTPRGSPLRWTLPSSRRCTARWPPSSSRRCACQNKIKIEHCNVQH